MIDREKVALAIGEVYHGRPIGRRYLTGIATGGRVWLTAADAAIVEVLRQVEMNLSAVQYDPAPYTALKHRLRALFPTSAESSNPAE